MEREASHPDLSHLDVRDMVVLHRREARILGGIDAAVGAWLVVSSFFFVAHASLAWSMALTGVVVTVLALCRAVGYREAWPSWVNLLLGLWTIVSPWVMVSHPSAAAEWDAVVTGLVLANLALTSAMATDTVPIG